MQSCLPEKKPELHFQAQKILWAHGNKNKKSFLELPFGLAVRFFVALNLKARVQLPVGENFSQWQ